MKRSPRVDSGVIRVCDTRRGNSGCHPSIFFPEKPGDLFQSSPSLPVLRCHPCLLSPEKLTTFLLIAVTFYSFHSGVTPPGRCHPALFLPVRPRFYTILCKFAHKEIFPLGVSPGGCHPGRSAPPPLRDAAGCGNDNRKRKVSNTGCTWVPVVKETTRVWCCVGVDECADCPENATCANTDDGSECYCDPGFKLVPHVGCIGNYLSLFCSRLVAICIWHHVVVYPTVSGKYGPPFVLSKRPVASVLPLFVCLLIFWRRILETGWPKNGTVFCTP